MRIVRDLRIPFFNGYMDDSFSAMNTYLGGGKNLLPDDEISKKISDEQNG